MLMHTIKIESKSSKTMCRSNELSGNIPPEYGGFAELTDLVLEQNDLSGNIPPSLGKLGSLSYFGLSYNKAGEGYSLVKFARTLPCRTSSDALDVLANASTRSPSGN
jgi:hypothetical protein